MSYNCSIEITNSGNISTENIIELESLFEKAGLRANINHNNYLTDVIDFYDDPTGVIYDWVLKNKLTFSIIFISEDEEEFDYQYIDGVEND